MIRNVFAVFFMWFVMYLIGILNGTTVWVSLLIYIAFRYDVHSTSRNMLNGISEWFKDWWKKNGASLWNKGKGKIPEGCMLIEDHKKICRKMEIEFKKKISAAFVEGKQFGEMFSEPPVGKDDAIFSYLYNIDIFNQHIQDFMKRSQTYTWCDYLGIEHHNANEKEINAAFRTRAARHHPDRNPNDPVALFAFQKISAARDLAHSWRKKSANSK